MVEASITDQELERAARQRATGLLEDCARGAADHEPATELVEGQPVPALLRFATAGFGLNRARAYRWAAGGARTVERGEPVVLTTAGSSELDRPTGRAVVVVGSRGRRP